MAETRRRGEVLEAAIAEAVWAELAESGYAGLTVGAVAERARTSKAVLYRRWPGRAGLVMAALAHHAPTTEDVPDTGSLRGDLLVLLRAIAAGVSGRSIDALWGLLTESARDPELAALVRERLAELQRSGPVVAIFDRAVARGEVDAARVTPRLLRLAPDLLRSELLVYGAISDAAVVEIVDEVVLPLAGV
ncbi:TetR/AcrR family transcriptional regulator [Jiangella rhizosphaerae]|uniref:TetR/AcrR family transcriptional regulator n=1 Tax=Jiangella rhizosphaerae TaxID=2293569 RepID=A0A418KP29_9ACTN|nr:TetR/AcrR family transcriptional regulator [Jiangella rhizosphaerae]RIQ20925.1 TetR/AcrR family transcriptional regulator [Jiangella rhizosphaerae]